MDAENVKALRAIAKARHADLRARRVVLAQQHNILTDEMGDIEKVLKATEPDEPEPKAEQSGEPDR